MGRNVAKGWEGRGGLLHRSPSLKERIGTATYGLRTQLTKLENASSRMQTHDKSLFEKCVAAQAMRDSSRAAMYANECAEVRKMSKIILRAEMALEQVMLRLETVEEFGDVVVVMGPVAGVVHSLKTQLAGVIPEVSYELGQIGEDLNKIVIDVGESTGQAWEIGSSGGEAQKILDDASAVAEQRMKERFPELPGLVPAAEGSHEIARK